MSEECFYLLLYLDLFKLCNFKGGNIYFVRLGDLKY